MVLGHNRGWPDLRKVTPLTYQVDNVGPFHRLVVLGESTVEGGGWVQNVQERWADLRSPADREKLAEYFTNGNVVCTSLGYKPVSEEQA